MRAPLRLSHVSRATSLAMAGVYAAVILSTPAMAYAQGPAQPVPYNPAPAPVPYSQPAPAPAPAGAAPAVGSDVIYMKNGGILRGTIIDAIPNAQARIQLATAEIATVQWSEIARIERGEAPKGKPPGAPAQGSSLPPLPSAGQAPSPGPPPPPPAPTMVMVHIDGPEDTQLEQDVSHEEHWQTVCTAPCDLKLPIGPDYRVTGPGIKASGVFGLEYQNGLREIVTVNAASKSWFVLGIVSTAVGGAAALIGALVGLSASLVASVDSGNGDTAGKQSADNTGAVAWTVAAVGAAAVVAGIILIVTNAKTRTTQEFAKGVTPMPIADAWRPLPAWKESSPAPGNGPWVPTTGVVMVPVFSGRF